LEAGSETGSAAKTQGQEPEKPLKVRISCAFAEDLDRPIKARAGHERQVDEKLPAFR
jgi:hypothetical protein